VRRDRDDAARQRGNVAGPQSKQQQTQPYNHGEYSTPEVGVACARLLADHLELWLYEAEAAGQSSRRLVPLIARARLLQRDVAHVAARRGGGV
jgi:hypothetical protein